MREAARGIYAVACCCVRAVLFGKPGAQPPGNDGWLLYPWDSVSQPEAQAICRQKGGDLVSISDKSEADELLTMLSTFPDVWLWLGLVAPDGNSALTSSWYWLRLGRTANGPTYENWYQDPDTGVGEPEAGFRCSQLNNLDGFWRSFSCAADTAGFVCDVGECQACQCACIACPMLDRAALQWVIC